jgi:hypothetical protein
MFHGNHEYQDTVEDEEFVRRLMRSTRIDGDIYYRLSPHSPYRLFTITGKKVLLSGVNKVLTPDELEKFSRV